ncbi:GPP34 family phosphoprotein [Corynebacterium sp. TA-R-1]|uniref:GPP34 family phosphoprotein n=1 Tax=Corynebacterium stercoris TaxID=2943490 RepID=A0ABT1G174_9CORY|nr:GPP34 family phosphoprotein [Corynebacterium stercoris]MCP1387592.1 GPP34 family phosphoprotein [Corynebacterium stercoris]
MLISEQVFLLLTADGGGGEAWVSSYRRYALGAAALADLAVLGAIELSDERRPRVTPLPLVQPLPTKFLAHAHAMIQRRPKRRAQTWIGDTRFGRIDYAADSLVKRGVLEEKSRGFLFVQWQQYPVRDASAELQLRGRAHQIFRGQAHETVNEGVALLLVDAVTGTRNVLKQETRDLPRKEVKRALDEIYFSLTSPELNRTPPEVAVAIRRINDALVMVVRAAQSSSS